MIDVSAFFNELEKIAAHKSRAGSTPIRPHNLAKKNHYDGSQKMTTKLSFIQLAKDIAAKGPLKGVTINKLKNFGLIGGGAIGAVTAQQAYKDWSFGRQIRKQQEG